MTLHLQGKELLNRVYIVTYSVNGYPVYEYIQTYSSCRRWNVSAQTSHLQSM